MARSGAAQTLEFAATGGTTWTNLTGPDSGASSAGMTVERASADATSGGLTTAVSGGSESYTFTVTVRETKATRGLFLGQYGRRGQARWRPAGAGSGNTQTTGNVICTINRNAPADDARMFDITLTVDGDITETTQA